MVQLHQKLGAAEQSPLKNCLPPQHAQSVNFRRDKPESLTDRPECFHAVHFQTGNSQLQHEHAQATPDYDWQLALQPRLPESLPVDTTKQAENDLHLTPDQLPRNQPHQKNAECRHLPTALELVVPEPTALEPTALEPAAPVVPDKVELDHH